MGKQTSKTYALFQGREKVYIGEAVNTERRAEQHRDERHPLLTTARS